MRLHALALLTLALAATGCRKSMAPGCRILCTCSPCTDDDLDGCLDKAEKAQDEAIAKGCGEVFDTFVSCFEDTARCKGTSSATTDACSRAERNLRTCADAGSPFADVCAEAQAKIANCTPNQMPVPSKDCSGQTECTSVCVLAAPCAALTGQVFDQTFNNCVNACNGLVNNGGGSTPPTP